jgi:hypothetical protein
MIGHLSDLHGDLGVPDGLVEPAELGVHAGEMGPRDRQRDAGRPEALVAQVALERDVPLESSHGQLLYELPHPRRDASGRTLLFSCYRFRPFFESSCWSRPARQSRPLDSAPGESHPLPLPCGLRSTRQGLLERLSATLGGTTRALLVENDDAAARIDDTAYYVRAYTQIVGNPQGEGQRR